MNVNKPFSQSLKKFIYNSDKVQLEVTKYLQRSHSSIHQNPIITLPSLHIHNYLNKSQKYNKTSSEIPLKRHKTQKQSNKINENGLRETNVSNGQQASDKSLKREVKKKGSLTNMQKNVDEIMNEVIAVHSPQLSSIGSIKRSISTKKFRNIRVVTDINEFKPTKIKTDNFLKQIMDFILNHSKINNDRSQQSKLESSIYKQDLSLFSPRKLIKKSQHILSLYRNNEFKRQEQQQCRNPISSKNYIRQLRRSKVFIKDVHLKKY